MKIASLIFRKTVIVKYDRWSITVKTIQRLSISSMIVIIYGAALGADIYVDGDNGVDALHRGSYDFPFKTIDYAYNQADTLTDNTMILKQGSYNNATQGASWFIDLDRDDVSVTIKPDMGAVITLDIETNNRHILKVNSNSATVTLENLTIQSPSAGRGIEFIAGKDTRLICNNCIIEIEESYSGDFGSMVYVNPYTTAYAKLRLTKCTLKQYERFRMFLVFNALDMEITGCTIMHPNGEDALFTFRSTIGNIYLNNNTISGSIHADGLDFHLLKKTDTLDQLRFTNNTVIGFKKMLYITDVILGSPIEWSGNTLTSTATDTLVGIGLDSGAIVNYINNPIFRNNTIIHSGGSGGHTVYWGSNIRGGVFEGNTIKNMLNSDWGFVVKGSHSIIENNIINGRLYLVGSQYNIIKNNRIDAGATSLFALQIGVDDVDNTRKPIGNYIGFNIIDGSAGKYAVWFNVNREDNNYYHWDNRFENNIYDDGSIALFYLDGRPYVTIFALHAKWAEWDNAATGKTRVTWHDNDQYSQIKTVDSRTTFIVDIDGNGTKEIVGLLNSDPNTKCVDPPFMDFNGDCKVNVEDLNEFISQWLTGSLNENCVDPPSMDFNNDCKVDFIDYCEFASEWMSFGP